MKISKYHGTGNDFVMIEDVAGERDLSPALVAALCDRHLGVGADGVIRIAPSDRADFFMDYWNAEGDVAEMCGNGVRCLAKYVFERGLTTKTELDVDTRAGIKHLVLDADGINAADVAMLKRRTGPTVITPHPGEFRRLTGNEASYRAAADLAAAIGSVVLLKGNPTFVMGAESWVVTSGGPELATIGTGDVLTGMVAALVARGVDLEAAARIAAHRHGKAGRDLASGGTVTATSLAKEIGRWAW